MSRLRERLYIWWRYRCPRILDTSCICRGNWREIVKDTEAMIDKRFKNRHGEEYVFFGIVHGSDDYYYGMSSVDPNAKRRLVLLSCVGSLDGHEYTPVAS